MLSHDSHILGLALLVAILSYPAGWDNSSVVGVCGPLVNNNGVQHIRIKASLGR